MDMKFKYFQITEKETLDYIEQCLVSIEVRNAAVKTLAKKLDAYDCLQWNSGGIAAFCFISRPDKTVWKSVKHGFMPKAKTDELKLVGDIPKAIDYRDIIKKYGFGGEMIMGDPERAGGGFPMHSSYIKGSRKTGFYAVKVPYQDEFDKEVHDSLIEIKEWEMLKGIEEGSK
jgi:hypothetical protein